MLVIIEMKEAICSMERSQIKICEKRDDATRV